MNDMIAIQIARIVVGFVQFLDIDDPDLLDPAVATQVRRQLAADLNAMDKSFLRELVYAFEKIAPEYGEESAPRVRNIPYAFHLEEAIAADDPLRLTELQAQRNAKER